MVDEFEARLQSRKFSLNSTVGDDSDFSLQDLLESDYDGAEARVEMRDQQRDYAFMQAALAALDDRARTIINARLLCEEENERTFQDLGAEFGISTERVRQIESAALQKLRRFMGVEEPVSKKRAYNRSKNNTPA